MNLNLYLGKNFLGDDVYLDLEKKNLHFTLLAGMTGSGKSIFHNNLYKQLSEQNTPQDLGFIFLDMTKVNFIDWKSPYVLLPPTAGDEAMDVLEKLAKKSISKTLFIHIEECDLFWQFPERIKRTLIKLLENDNVYIVYSTSRPGEKEIPDWLKVIIDLKVVFTLASHDDCITLSVGDEPLHFLENKRLLVYKDKNILCKPFTTEEAKQLENFKL